MHICIPDTREVKPRHGAAYLLYNIHIDGLYHCSLRYKQLLHLHLLLTKRFNNWAPSNQSPYQLPQFPPKKILPLSSGQIEERRMQLEKYLQYISQDKLISSSSIFNLFLLEAQRESTQLLEKHVHLDIELVNGHKIRLPIQTHDSADDILQACCRALGLTDRYHAYFCLCLCGYDVVRDKLIIKRRLSSNEAPFITLQMAIQQQEQLQSVLSSSLVASSNSNSTVGRNKKLQVGRYPTQAATVDDCHCLSCCQQQQIQSATTCVPSVGSSSSSSSAVTSDLFINGDSIDDSGLGHYNNNNTSNSNNNYNNNNNDHRCICQCLWQDQMTNGKSDYRQANNNCRSFVTHRILLRKSYWDPLYDTYILNDQQALNLLFIQTVYDMKHSLMFVDRDTYHQLEALLEQDMKLEYILLARTLKYYNYVHFEPCYSDYPRPRTKVMISIGSKELNMRVLKEPKPRSINDPPSSSANNNTKQSSDEPVLYCTSSLVPSGYEHLITKYDIVEEEFNFKVPLIRCWRLTSLETLNSNVANQNGGLRSGSPASSRSRNNSTSQPVATTTLAGGKRRSWSLFNSIVGNSPPSKPSNSTSNNQHTNTLSGSDGTSLLTTLASLNNDNTTNGSSSNNNSSSVSATRNFTDNSIQRNGSSNNSTQHSPCHQSQHHDRCASMAGGLHQQDQPMSQYELSFEYLITKDTLKWITISSDQAIFISISLQGVVDELVSKRDGSCYLQQQSQHIRRRQQTSSASQWPLYFNPSPPRSDQTTTQLIPPLYPSGNQANGLILNSAGNNFDKQRDRHSQDEQSEQSIESFPYTRRDGSQRQLIGRLQHGDPASSRSFSSHEQQLNNDASTTRQFRRESSRTFTLIPSFWSSSPQTSNGQAGAIFSASPTSSTSSSSIIRKLSNGSVNGNAGGTQLQRENQPAGIQVEISSLSKKAPSPILNNSYDSTVNHDDDLL